MVATITDARPRITQSKAFLLITATLLLLALACATSFADEQFADFTVAITAVNSSVTADQAGQYTLTITNFEASARSFSISSPDFLGWDIHTEPRTDYVVTVDADSVKDVALVVQPNGDQRGHFNLRIAVTEDASGRIIENTLAIDVRSPSLGPGQPLMRVELDAPDTIDPREGALIKVKIKSLVPRALSDVTVNIDSVLIKDSATIPSLGPLEERSQVFSASFDPQQEPQDDVIRAEVLYVENNRTYRWATEKKTFSVIAYSDIVQTTDEQDGFLRTQQTFTIRNDGNIPKETTFKYPMPLLKSWFSSLSVPSQVQRINGERYETVPLTIEPDGKRAIVVVSNYRSLFIIALLAVIGIVLYLVFRSPIILRKGAASLDKLHDGMSEIKVTLYIKNRSAITFENIKVLDKVPHLTEMSKDFQVGTLKPTQITRLDKNYALVKYVIGTLDPFEERIITYKIKSKLTMIGGLTLPEASVKYAGKNKRVRTFTTPKVILQ